LGGAEGEEQPLRSEDLSYNDYAVPWRQEVLGAFDGVLEAAQELSEIFAAPCVPMRILLQRIPEA
jgi:hypothetical protein